MSEVFIPLGGAGGKNRGSQYKIPENAQTVEMLGSVFIPLPPGVYKKYVLPNGQPALPSADGGDAVVSMSKEFLKKQAIKTFGIASITNFSLTMYAHRQVRLTWAKPSQGLWSGVHFVFKYGSMPTSETDGFMVYDSADVHYETARLDERELFVRAYSYVTVRDGRWYDEGAVSARITVTGISGSVTFGAGAGTWTVPDGVRRIRYILVGHGGNGGEGHTNQYGTGGGGGGYFTTGYMSVTPGQAISWIIPTLQGSSTVLGDIVSKSGENGNNTYYMDNGGVYGGDGGSGGGAGTRGRNPTVVYGGDGGANGSDGGQSTVHRGGTIEVSRGYNKGGIGQHSSTIGFNGVQYSGGGCGGGSKKTTQEGGGGIAVDYHSAPRRYRTAPLKPEEYAKACGVNGLGGGAGGYTPINYGGDLNYDESKYGAFLPSPGGTGCIYIAWGNLMND